MTSAEIIGGAGLLITLTGVVSAFLFKLFRAVSDLERDAESKRARIYGRIDEVKQTNRTEFTSKELCDERYKNVKDTLEEIKNIVACIPKIKAGIDLILKNNGHSTE